MAYPIDGDPLPPPPDANNPLSSDFDRTAQPQPFADIDLEPLYDPHAPLRGDELQANPATPAELSTRLGQTADTTSWEDALVPLSIGDLVDHEAAAHARRRPFQGVDDATLVARMQAFDPTAISEMYERYLPGLIKYVYYRTGSLQTAEDLADEAVLKALLNLQRYTDHGVPFSAWLYRIANNLTVDHFRRAPASGREMSLEEHLVSTRRQDLLKPGRKAEPSPADTSDVEDDAEGHFLSSALRAVMHDLTDEQAQVVTLKYVDGLSNIEVAQILGKSEGAVKSLQHRALATLGRALASRGFEFHVPVNDRASAEVDYSFRAALLQRPAHMLNYDLKTDTDPARAQARRDLVEAHIMPYIDHGFVDIDDPKAKAGDVSTDLTYRKIMYWLLVEEASISQIERRLGEDPNALLDQARGRVLDHIQKRTGLDFREIYDLLRGTGWLFTVSRPIRTNIVALSEYRRATRTPDVQLHSTFTIHYTPEKLESMLGTPNFQKQRRHLASSMPMRIQRGQRLDPREGAHILVHQQRIAATDQVSDDEMLHFGAPRVIKPQENRPLVIGDSHFGAINERYPSGVAVDDCVISLVHPDAHVTMDELPDDMFNKVAQQRRDEVVALYPDLVPVSSYGEVGLPIGLIATRVEQLLTTNGNGTQDRVMNEAFRGLSPSHRALLRLTFITKMPDDEIARKLHLVREHGPSASAVADARLRAYELLYNYLLAIGEEQTTS